MLIFAFVRPSTLCCNNVTPSSMTKVSVCFNKGACSRLESDRDNCIAMWMILDDSFARFTYSGCQYSPRNKFDGYQGTPRGGYCHVLHGNSQNTLFLCSQHIPLPSNYIGFCQLFFFIQLHKALPIALLKIASSCCRKHFVSLPYSIADLMRQR